METSIRARYAETDAMGVVYHSHYLIWFEVGRNEWFRATGFNYRDVEASGILLPVSEVSCRYRRSAHYDDVVLIRVTTTQLTAARLEFSYTLTRQSDGTLLAEGKTVHAFVNPQGRPANLRKVNPALWDVLLARLNQ